MDTQQVQYEDFTFNSNEYEENDENYNILPFQFDNSLVEESDEEDLVYPLSRAWNKTGILNKFLPCIQ